MFAFVKKLKNDYKKNMCGSAVSTASAVLDELDRARTYESFRSLLGQLEYHAQQARAYFNGVEWNRPTDEILAEADVERLEFQVLELDRISFEEFDLMMDVESHEAIPLTNSGLTRKYIDESKGACKKCGEITQTTCGCADWICVECSLGDHPEYPYIMCNGCK